ncbi:MAG: PilZ domain-containing protein [Pyrinomonadaceae bacterium]
MADIEMGEAVSASERRNSDRKKLIIDVKFDGGDGTGIANTRDIGAGGLYMTTTASLDTGVPIMMTVNIGADTLNLKGVVVYSDPGHGVGVRFKDLNETDEGILRRELELL